MTDRKRILLSAGMIQSGLSGVGRYVIELSRNLEACTENEQIHVCGLASDRKLFPWIPEERWIGIPEWAGGGVKNLVWHQFFLPGLLKRSGVDLVHIPSYRRILAYSPVPQVATIHDCAPFHLRDKYGLLRGLFGRSIVPFLARRCRHVLTVSQATMDDLVRYMKLHESGVTVVWNGIDEKTYRVQSDAALAAFREEKNLGERFFLYIARLEHPGKNHVRLIEAFEKVCGESDEKIRLVLGGADWHGSDVIHRRVGDSPVKDRIHMAGFIKEEEMPLWYGSACALVFPSLFEGFGLPIAEALACGTRVLSSDRGSLLEVGGDAVDRLNPESIESIAATMRNVLQEPVDERSRRIAHGLERSRLFSWSRTAKRTCALYRDLIGNK